MGEEENDCEPWELAEEAKVGFFVVEVAGIGEGEERQKESRRMREKVEEERLRTRHGSWQEQDSDQKVWNN